MRHGRKAVKALRYEPVDVRIHHLSSESYRYGLEVPNELRAVLKRAERAGLAWPLKFEWDDAALERALFPSRPSLPAESRGLPDFATVHRELKRKSVTLFLLWEEYKAAHPDGFQYSWFCQRYRAFAKKVDLVMRQSHRAGETTFVDYAGQTVGIVDRATGDVRQAQVFIAVLGASNYSLNISQTHHTAQH